MSDLVEGVSTLEVENALREAKGYIGAAYGREPGDDEIALILEEVLREKRKEELRRKFTTLPPRYIRACLAYLAEQHGGSSSVADTSARAGNKPTTKPNQAPPVRPT